MIDPQGWRNDDIYLFLYFPFSSLTFPALNSPLNPFKAPTQPPYSTVLKPFLFSAISGTYAY